MVLGMVGQQCLGSLLEGLQLLLTGCNGEELGYKGHGTATWPVTMPERAQGILRQNAAVAHSQTRLLIATEGWEGRQVTRFLVSFL